MRFRILAIVLALFAAFSSDSQGHSQDDAPVVVKEDVQPNDKKVSTDKAAESVQKKAEAPPIIVNVLPPAKTDHEAEDERLDRKEKADLDRRLVALTADLAYFTAGLFAATAALVIATAALAYYAFRQSRDMKASLALGSVAARAADLSAKAAIGLELPILGAIAPPLQHIDGPIPAGGAYASGDIERFPDRYSAIPWVKFRNAGRTSAFLDEILIGWEICVEQPTAPRFSRSYSFAGEIIRQEADHDIELHFQIELTKDQISILESKQGFLWVYFRVCYQDFLSNVHRPELYWRWDNPGGGMHLFERGGNPYTKYALNTQQGGTDLSKPT